MALARNWRLRAGADGRTGAAEGFRHLLADRRGPVDPRSPRIAARRHLLLHQGGRAVDVVVLAGAGAVCDELQSGGLDRAGGSRRELHRRDLRIAHSHSRPPHSRSLCGRRRDRGAGAFEGAFSGAPACAGAAGHAGVGVRADVGERARPGAVAMAAAVDRAVGEPARRVRVRPGAGRRVRARCAVECGPCTANVAGAALDGVRHRRAGSLLRHALRVGIDPRRTQDPRSRRTPASDL